MKLSKIEKERVLEYLKSGTEIATAASCAIDHQTNKYTNIPLATLSDEKYYWTTEDIYNFEVNGEVFDEELLKFILK